MGSNVWKLQDAKARFSELVRRAQAGEPQRVTLHGKEAVIVADPKRFEVRPKPAGPRTMRDFLKACEKYRGVTEGIDFDSKVPMKLRDKRGEIFDGPFEDENNP
jgi:prevent-host-death family protein